MKTVAQEKDHRDEKKAAEALTLSRYGVPLESIASYLNLSPAAMKKIYGAEIATGRAEAGREVGRTIFEKALSGDMAALVFWAKTQMGWKEAAKQDSQTAGAAEIKIYKLPDNGRK
ncbi:MAG: hypothetical protein ACRCTY_10370 [Candidatus Adiutrix sp.]